MAVPPVPVPPFLDTRERRFGFAAAGLALALAVVGVFAEPKHSEIVKGHVVHPASHVEILGVGAVACLILIGTTLWGKRLPFALAAFMVGEATTLTVSLVFGLPFIALALWQILRITKANRGRAFARAQGGSGTGSVRASSGRGSVPPSSGIPSASKRYTPPKRRPQGAARDRSLRTGTDRERSSRP